MLCASTFCFSRKRTHLQGRRHRRFGFHPRVGKSPWRREWQPTPVLLPGESNGQGSLAGYSPWGCKDTTEQLCLPGSPSRSSCTGHIRGRCQEQHLLSGTWAGWAPGSTFHDSGCSRLDLLMNIPSFSPENCGTCCFPTVWRVAKSQTRLSD